MGRDRIGNGDRSSKPHITAMPSENDVSACGSVEASDCRLYISVNAGADDNIHTKNIFMG